VYVLDTDIFSLYYTRQTPIPALEQKIVEANDRLQLFTSIVVAKEALKGGLAVVNRRESTAEVVRAYTFFQKVLTALSELRMLPLDADVWTHS